MADLYVEDRIKIGWERLKDRVYRLFEGVYDADEAEFDSFLDKLVMARNGEVPDYLTTWTPMMQRSPYHPGKYLITTTKGYVRVNEWYGDHWRTSEGVNAWMPLPRPYKEEKQVDKELDYVAVVLCEKCAHFRYVEGNFGVCMYNNRKFFTEIADYCSRGEEKDE